MVMDDDWSHMDYCTIKDAPAIQGIYFLMNGDELVYIGQSNNIRRRLSSHNNNWNCTITVGGKKLYTDSFDGIYYFECDYKPERKTYEAMYIDDYYPKLNSNDWILYVDQVFADLIRQEPQNYVEGWRPDPTRFDTYTQR
jgi:hypothetical protein